ncbi:hypothetical protein SEPCBS119000_001308 [Sporothrix epigloea]|uniref:FAD dependent oxidoreductase n=1 Tax=Sporothrix epigloea TaxID=1892477 RepID=A0ABP0D9Z3_9PEZI
MPDLNSVPPSPRALAASRQPSSTNTASTAVHNDQSPAASFTPNPGPQMPQPPASVSPISLHVFPSNQMAVNQGSNVNASSLPSPFLPPAMPLTSSVATPSTQPSDGPAVATNPGPLRHSRPLTAAELHMQMEKEQEAVVNRFTRELMLLRAQNASVVSNASSTSASGVSDAATGAASSGGPMSAPSIPTPADHPLFSGTSGFSIPSSAGRHNRTYSNTSIRSQAAAAGSTPSVTGITAPVPIRPTAPYLSRQNSTASRRSRANSPGPSASASNSYTHPLHIGEASVLGTTRSDDFTIYRAELENVKRENELLRRRIRELERAAAVSLASSVSGGPPTSTLEPSHYHGLQGHTQHSGSNVQRQRRDRRSSDASRGRSDSVSTNASIRVQTPGSVPPVVVPTVSASSPSAAFTTPATSGGGAGIAGRRESARERVTSMLSAAGSTAGSVGVGVPDDEVRVGESAASAGLQGQEGIAGGRSSGN